MKAINRWLSAGVLVAVVAYAAIDGPRIATRIAFAVTQGQNQAAREHLATLAKGDTLSPLFVEVAKVLRPAVVEVRVTKKVKMQETPDINQFFQHFFGDEAPFGLPQSPGKGAKPQPREYLQRGLGSGVVIDAKNGYILTNYHVVGGADETQVVLPDGRTLKVEWARTDPMTDLAIVKVGPTDLIEAPLGDSDAMQVGDCVLAIGAPEGLEQTVTAGIISAKGRVTDHAKTYQSFIQTDAAINHGNSGGPLVNTKGEVIGINTAIVSESGGNEGIGFAIPSNMVKSVMTQLIEKGKVTRGYLGVAIQGVDEKLAKSFHLSSTKGALIASVTPDGPAAKAGLKSGDFIVSVAGKPVENSNELRNLVAGLEVGKSVPVEFYRDGKKTSVSVTIETQPANMFAAGEMPEGGETTAGKFGLQVQTVTKELAQQYGYKTTPKGVVITQVTPGSSADSQGLKEGMVITQVQDKDIDTAEQFKEAVSAKEAAEGVRLRVTDPSGMTRFVFLPPSK
ncbi:MAG: Do family serine endopeptidase [Planctomycetaceae bacterium]|nr:Do family serine endopeptidase [Planctomycetaceae bacterium]